MVGRLDVFSFLFFYSLRVTLAIIRDYGQSRVYFLTIYADNVQVGFYAFRSRKIVHSKNYNIYIYIFFFLYRVALFY